MLKQITQQELNKLLEKANQSPRKRINYNFHSQADDPLQRMLHAMNTGTYVQPHKHEDPDKREVFLVLQGRATVVEFDDTGEIVKHVILDRNAGTLGVEIPERTWHTLLALEDNTVLYEVKDGPYSPIDDKNFAPWAPKEGAPECREYLNKLLAQVVF